MPLVERQGRQVRADVWYCGRWIEQFRDLNVGQGPAVNSDVVHGAGACLARPVILEERQDVICRNGHARMGARVGLIENAIQHSPNGGSVTVEAKRVSDGKQNWIQCTVIDQGPGISEQDLPKLFEPFFSKRRGGTGLGLAIAHRIMEEHGGKLIAGNNPERGACMIARFPVPPEGD